MGPRLELKYQIDKIIREAETEHLDLLKQDIDLFLGAANSLTAVLADRYKSQRLERPKSQEAPTKPRNSLSAPETKLDSSKPSKSAQARPQAVSRIQQGILQASAQQALRREVYGPQNPEVAFLHAAKAIAG